MPSPSKSPAGRGNAAKLYDRPVSGQNQSHGGSSTVFHNACPSRPGAGDRRPAAGLVTLRVSRETQAGAQRIGDAVAVEVGVPTIDRRHPRLGFPGRNEVAKRPPRFGWLGAKGPELAVGLAPEVGQAVAVQVGDIDPGEPHGPVQLASRRSLQHMHGRRIEVRLIAKPALFGIVTTQGTASSGHPSGPRPHQRGAQIQVYLFSGRSTCHDQSG